MAYDPLDDLVLPSIAPQRGNAMADGGGGRMRPPARPYAQPYDMGGKPPTPRGRPVVDPYMKPAANPVIYEPERPRQGMMQPAYPPRRSPYYPNAPKAF